METKVTSEANRIIGLYQRHAYHWATDRASHLFEKPMLDRFLALMLAGSSILDVGCGSSDPIGRYFIEQGYDITGVDSSKDLIDICQSKFPRQNWIIADMRKLSLERRFGGILAWDSFFHLCPEDQREMFPVFRKHAAPKAVLMFTSGPAYGEAIGTYRGEPLYHGSLDGTEYRLLLAENGFQAVLHLTEEPTDGGHTVWLAQFA
jgi:2-polyprenyl-3-methyl-5-hydroxy-6-metoxy-1,4-benzoquinol methylase